MLHHTSILLFQANLYIIHLVVSCNYKLRTHLKCFTNMINKIQNCVILNNILVATYWLHCTYKRLKLISRTLNPKCFIFVIFVILMGFFKTRVNTRTRLRKKLHENFFLFVFGLKTILWVSKILMVLYYLAGFFSMNEKIHEYLVLRPEWYRCITFGRLSFWLKDKNISLIHLWIKVLIFIRILLIFISVSLIQFCLTAIF